MITSWTNYSHLQSRESYGTRQLSRFLPRAEWEKSLSHVDWCCYSCCFFLFAREHWEIRWLQSVPRSVTRLSKRAGQDLALRTHISLEWFVFKTSHISRKISHTNWVKGGGNLICSALNDCAPCSSLIWTGFRSTLRHLSPEPLPFGQIRLFRCGHLFAWGKYIIYLQEDRSRQGGCNPRVYRCYLQFRFAPDFVCMFFVFRLPHKLAREYITKKKLWVQVSRDSWGSTFSHRQNIFFL